jgi:hypothetical protein
VLLPKEPHNRWRVLQALRSIHSLSRVAANRRRLRFYGAGLDVRASRIAGAGRGLFCTGDGIKPGDHITDYEGAFIGKNDARDALSALQHSGIASHWCQAHEWVICGIKTPVPGLGAGSFANHAAPKRCNARVQLYKLGPNHFQAVLVATRYIAPGTEVLINYGTTYFHGGHCKDVPAHLTLQYTMAAAVHPDLITAALEPPAQVCQDSIGSSSSAQTNRSVDAQCGSQGSMGSDLLLESACIVPEGDAEDDGGCGELDSGVQHLAAGPIIPFDRFQAGSRVAYCGCAFWAGVPVSGPPLPPACQHRLLRHAHDHCCLRGNL